MEVPTLERWPVVLSLTEVILLDIVSGSRIEVAPNHSLKGLPHTGEIMDSQMTSECYCLGLGMDVKPQWPGSLRWTNSTTLATGFSQRDQNPAVLSLRSQSQVDQ